MHCTSGRTRILTTVAAIGVTAALVAAPVAPSAQAHTRAASTTFLNGAGSTFIFPLMSKWAFQYSNSVDKFTRVNYVGVGSGTGVSYFTKGTVDFAGTDAFMNDAQIRAAGGDVLHLPMTIGPVALTYNLPGLKDPLKLDGPTLALIFEGKITNWSDKLIAGLNPGVSVPNQSIVVAHRADSSGTSFIFTNYLSAVSADWKSNYGASTAVNWPAGQGARGTAGVAAIVKQSVGGIGYVELSYALASNLPVVSMKNKAGNFVAPSIQSAAADAAGAGTLPPDLRAIIVNADGANAYPITGFSWVVIHQHAPNNTKYATLLKFLWWCAHTGQTFSSSGALRYASLPANIVAADETKIKSVTYNGKPLFTGQ